jgi:nucleotide-binding universal stress UspA family protein
MSGSIICGVDDSESAKGAARVARGLSALLGRRLVFVRVVEPGLPNERISAVAERLQRLTEDATEVDPGAGWLVDVGHPADRLVAAANDEGASLIVVGSTGPRSSLLGSISADVSRRAPCPVVVVPPDADGVVAETRGETEFSGGIARFGSSSSDGDTEFAGGIARLGSSSSEGDTEFAGGIARFSLGSRRSQRTKEPYDPLMRRETEHSSSPTGYEAQPEEASDGELAPAKRRAAGFPAAAPAR